MALSIATLEAFTNKKIVPRVADATFAGQPFAYFIKEHHAIRVGGSRSITMPILIKESNSEWYSGADSATLEILDQFTSSEFNWKWLRVPFVLTEEDIDKNDGDDGVVNLLESVEEAARMTMVEALSDGLFGTNASNSKQMDGLQDMFGATGTSYGSILDTDVASPAKWLTEIIAPLSGNIISEHDIRRMRGAVTRGISKPNLGLVNFPNYNKIWTLPQSDQRWGQQKMADIGFDHIMFEGMPIVPDEHAPGSGYTSTDNWMMLLNMDYVQFWVHRNKAFVSRIYQPIPQQEVYIGKILLGCNLTTNNRRMHVVNKTFDPAD